MLIDGIGLAGYRSFGADLQKIGPLGKVNLLIGKNNSGKSNVLRFMSSHYSELHTTLGSDPRQSVVSFQDVDRHLGLPPENIRLACAHTVGSEGCRELIDSLDTHTSNRDTSLELVRQLLTSVADSDAQDVWFIYRRHATNWQFAFDDDFLEAIARKAGLDANKWNALCIALTGGAAGSKENVIAKIMGRISPFRRECPAVAIVPAIRKVGEKGSTPDDFSGLGIISRLAQLQHPTHGATYDEQKRQFETINTFLQNVTGSPDGRLEIEHDASAILVHMDGKTLPLPALGTGIHEVVILASAATVLRRTILCIEEPELHLHPVLQKKLVGYLQDHTDNQYLISTHSAHLLDAGNAEVFHITLKEGRSVVQHAVTSSQRFSICGDLGFRASDLLQANSVIWVEGPSDRIYLTHWLNIADPSLIEGLHYSIMFYGGRLLAHLSATDPEVKDFVSLLRLNRCCAVVMDSDRTGPKMAINETKQRVQNELKRLHAPCWVTKGREIENYIPQSTLDAAVLSVHPSVKAPARRRNEFARALAYKRRGKDIFVDKVRVARKVVEAAGLPASLDLERRLTELVRFIRLSNGLGRRKSASAK